MADNTVPKPTSSAIIPSGSQLNDPVAAGLPTSKAGGDVDPFNNPNWLETDDEFKRQPVFDADPHSPGVDVFGGNINDLPQDITVPRSTPAPEAVTPAPVVPLAQAPVQPEPVAATPAPITVAPEQLAVAATMEEPKAKALNKLVDQVISPKTRRNVNLAVIFILLILVFILASATVYLMLRGPVNVTINTGRAGTSQQSSQSSSQSSSTVTTTTTSSVIVTSPESIYTYMVLLNSDNTEAINAADLPEGSIELGNSYLVKVLLADDIVTDDPVKEALTGLFEIKDATYGEEGYRNYLSRANLAVETTQGDVANPEVEINLVGEFTVAQLSDITYAKQQIERTIENYTLNYRISLNGDESAYTCLGSSDASCR